ncbi:hypothetical protein SISSUDRAFT_959180, partial [Sistotremastrum suecicum HHB10207 ss-3]
PEDPVAEENDGLPETDDVGKPEEPHRLADEEEDETARKKRIAERLARMGGFNPFGAPLKVPKSVIPPPISSMTSKDQDIAVSPRQARSASPPRASQLEQDDPTATSAEDAEGSRRRTLAERMARLGGVKFGALPPVPQKRATVSIPEDGAHSAPSGPDSEVQPEEETV